MLLTIFVEEHVLHKHEFVPLAEEGISGVVGWCVGHGVLIVLNLHFELFVILGTSIGV